MEMWKCSNCGFVHPWATEPDECGKCKEEDTLEKLSDEAAEKIERAWRTNDLHMQLNAIAEQMEDIGREGAKENLDPACYKIFDGARKCAEKLQQRVKAEIATHAEKGKWG